jgi:hypothetical protein
LYLSIKKSDTPTGSLEELLYKSFELPAGAALAVLAGTTYAADAADAVAAAASQPSLSRSSNEAMCFAWDGMGWATTRQRHRSEAVVMSASQRQRGS